MKALLAAAALGVSLWAWGAEVPQAQIINLSCVEALASVGQAAIAGVFSFIPEKDSPAAFADLLAHNRKAMKKFLAKAEKDLKEVSGVSIWDHQALQFTLLIYGSPLAETLEKPSTGLISRISELVAAPVLTLEQMTARRRQ
jgi:hypothetical protein